MDRAAITAIFEKYIRKLRITPAWDIKLEFVEDSAWPKTGDFKIDCDDRKAILMLNALANIWYIAQLHRKTKEMKKEVKKAVA